MKYALVLLTIYGLLGSCGSQTKTDADAKSDVGAALDQQAIAMGILPDPDNIDLAGRYETRSDLGTDKFCAVGQGKDSFDIGVLAVFGPDSKCEGQGTAVVKGDNVEISLKGAGSCNFAANFDGIEISFPGSLEKGCDNYCSPRASLSGTSYFMVEQGNDKARRALGRDIELLCGI